MTFRQKLQRRAVKGMETKALKTFSPYDVIVAPILTEKTVLAQEKGKKYSFKVIEGANKNDVKEAIEYLYKVSPIKINIVKVPFKGRGQRKTVRSAYKKAIVTLSENDKIEL